MSDLKKKQLALWEFYLKGAVERFSPDNNVVYFYDNLDVRVCPKNGLSTLKAAYNILSITPNWEKDIFPQMKPVGKFSHTRIVNVYRYSYWNNFPFRKDSYRVALKRDPVERFISAVNMMYKKTESIDWLSKVSPKPIDYTDMTLEDILSGLEDGTINNIHFQPQSYFMGNVKDYDKVFYTKDLKDLLVFVCNFKSSDLISAETKLSVTSLHVNITPRYYWRRQLDSNW